MFYIVAFILGGFARTIPKLLLFAAVYMVLYSALIFALEAQELQAGTTSAPYILGRLIVDWAVGFAICGFGYLCRLVFVGQRPRPEAERHDEIGKTFD